jgi:hypothetical protein
MRKQCIAAIFAIVFAPAYAQLHLITGSPTPKYNQTFASALFQVADDGSINFVAELVPSNIGTNWITISYDLRKVIFFRITSSPWISRKQVS